MCPKLARTSHNVLVLIALRHSVSRFRYVVLSVLMVNHLRKDDAPAKNKRKPKAAGAPAKPKAAEPKAAAPKAAKAKAAKAKAAGPKSKISLWAAKLEKEKAQRDESIKRLGLSLLAQSSRFAVLQLSTSKHAKQGEFRQSSSLCSTAALLLQKGKRTPGKGQSQRRRSLAAAFC